MRQHYESDDKRFKAAAADYAGRLVADGVKENTMSTNDEKGYNGWTNYETWNVKLWLDNEEYTYHDMVDLARHAIDSGRLAGQIKEYVEDMMPDLGASMFADLLGAALHEVDWYEIAEAYFEENNEAEDEIEEV